MGSALDMSLDDLIKKNKKPPPVSDAPRRVRPGGGRGYSGGGGGPAGAGPGPARRLPSRYENRINPYSSFEKAPDFLWQHDMYNQFGTGVANGVAGSSIASNSSMELGTKLHVSNLDYGISNEDIKELFGEAGELKRYSINYDRSGRSKGTAEVVFAKRADAIAAVKRYNDVQLDGKAMKIEIIGTNIQTPPLAPLPPPPFKFPSTFGNFNPAASGSGSGRGFGWVGTGGRNDRDRESRVKKKVENQVKKKVSVSASDLDAELDKYMQSN